jgi:molybdopterin-dependent oxidoreductase alpha subunit
MLKIPKTAGGWRAIFYSFRMANKVGWMRLWKAMTTKNACKTCALGMGGQAGGMRNEAGHWPEVCKKSFQAMVADMQKGITPEFFAKYSIKELQALSSRELEWCGRLVHPLYAGPGDTHYRIVNWDFAFNRIVKQMKDHQPQEHFFYASGRSSNEAGFLLQLFSRLYGTNYVNNCSFYCHQASGSGLAASLGTGTATVDLHDLDKTDLFFLIGGNPASNHPRLMRTLMQIRRRGGKVIVINPVKEIGLVNFSVPSDVLSLFFGTNIATHYLQPHIGGDLALLYGIAKLLIEQNQVDQSFLEASTEGVQEFKTMLDELSWDTIEKDSGISKAQIQEVADVYAKSKNAVFGWTMGITHHLNGTSNVRAIVNLALLRGMVGKPSSGLLPIRGHSNVQGIGSMGVVPNLKENFLNNLEGYLKTTLPRSPGLDTMACMQATHDGQMKAAFCLGGNLFGSNPDSNFAADSLAKLDLITYLNTTLNTGHAWGLAKETLILPVLARDEEPQLTTQESMFNFVRVSDGGPARYSGLKSEVEILATLGSRVVGDLPNLDWRALRMHRTIREMISQIVPGYEDISKADISKAEFPVKGRIFHEGHFPTSSGKASFSTDALTSQDVPEGELRLMTVRSEGQFNTVVYEEQDIYRGQERRDVILLNPEDIKNLGLKEDDEVTVSSAIAKMGPIKVRPFDIRQGNALMYFPEANVLVSKDIDPVSRTPSFKNVFVKVSRYKAEAGKTPLAVV